MKVKQQWLHLTKETRLSLYGGTTKMGALGLEMRGRKLAPCFNHVKKILIYSNLSLPASKMKEIDMDLRYSILL